MDLERVEQYVLRCPIQELEFRHASGVYVLGNVPTKPAWWSVGHQATGQLLWDWYTCRGLRTVITLIEQTYPEFYVWLVFRFPEEGTIIG